MAGVYESVLALSKSGIVPPDFVRSAQDQPGPNAFRGDSAPPECENWWNVVPFQDHGYVLYRQRESPSVVACTDVITRLHVVRNTTNKDHLMTNYMCISLS
jgi:hypothetical protein